MNHLVNEHVRRNTVSRPFWQTYGPHRHRVTDLLVQAAPTGKPMRLCVLGAGNCNDLDLGRLTGAFSEVHLVDLDAAALAAGVAQQQVDEPQSIVQHGGVDVTGVVEQLGQYRQDTAVAEASCPQPTVSDDAVKACMQQAVTARPPLSATFDVAASVCLLTQLIDSVRLAVGEKHPMFVPLVLAVRDRHLRMLAEMVTPGGQGVLMTDVVSSDTCPDLASTTDEQLPGRLQQMIAEHNFFTGVNPFVLDARFREDPMLATSVTDVRLIRPWLWQMGQRCYAVSAVMFQRLRC